MTVKQTRASARKAIAGLPSWTDKYGKMTPKRLTAIGLEKRSYADVVGELSMLRNMLVRPEFIISPMMNVQNTLTTERMTALRYGIQRMTPVKILVHPSTDTYGSVGGPNAFRPLPNRSVRENASGSNRQLGALRQMFTEGPCPKCGRDVGFDTVHWKGGRSSLACCHLVAEALGGATDYTNVVVACAECNYQSGAYTETAVLFLLRRIQIVVPIHVDRPE